MKKLFILALILLFPLTASAATYTISDAGGDWSSNGTWVEGSPPTDTDDVVAQGDGSSGTLTVNGAETCATIDLSDYDQDLILEANLTVTGNANLSGQAQGNRLMIRSDTMGTARTLSIGGTITAANVLFRDITAAGAASWDLSAATGGSGDAGGNTGITFTTAANVYWVSDVDGVWSDAKWFTESGGTTPLRVPLPQDTAVLDRNSFQTEGIDFVNDTIHLSALDMTDVANGPMTTFAVNGQTFYGDVKLSVGIDGWSYVNSAWMWRGGYDTYFSGRGNHVYVPGNVSMAGNASGTAIINAPGGTYTMAAGSTFDGAYNGSIKLMAGTFVIDDDVRAVVRSFTTEGTLAKTLTLNNCEIHMMGDFDFSANTNLTVNDNSSRIVMMSGHSTATTFDGGGKTWNHVEISENHRWGSGADSQTIAGSNTFNKLTIRGGRDVFFTAGTTQNIGEMEFLTDNYYRFGYDHISRPAVLNSTTTSAFTLNYTGSGTIEATNLNLTYSTATPADTWYAKNSTNGGNNTGWTFGDAPIVHDPEALTIKPDAPLAFWVNNGVEKIRRDDLRASRGETTTDSFPHMGDVINNVWDGSEVTIYGAGRETVSFSLYIEAPNPVDGLTVEMSSLVSGGNSITTETRDADDTLYDYTGRNIELFYVRYYPTRSLNQSLANGLYYPTSQLPRDGNLENNPGAGFNQREVAEKYYPEITVPIELEQPFSINRNELQQIWVDIWIPADQASGDYDGTLTVKQDGAAIASIPVNLEVYDFNLPNNEEFPMAGWNSHTAWAERYSNGTTYDGLDANSQANVRTYWNNTVKLLRRHRMQIMESRALPNFVSGTGGWGWGNADFYPILEGTLFTEAFGYEGPGYATGPTHYIIGPFGVMYDGGWDLNDNAPTITQTEIDLIHTNSDSWYNFFLDYPSTETYVYLQDEPGNTTAEPARSEAFQLISEIAAAFRTNTGVGVNLKTYLTEGTRGLVEYESYPIDVDAALGCWESANATADNTCQKLDDAYETGGGVFMNYNIAWGHEFPGIPVYASTLYRYYYYPDSPFYWQYNLNAWKDSIQTPLDIINYPTNWGNLYEADYYDYEEGTIYGYAQRNLDGILIYPGYDAQFPDSSYDVRGALAGIRLKLLRMGSQARGYAALASDLGDSQAATVQTGLNVLFKPSRDWAGGLQPYRSWDPDDWDDKRKAWADLIVAP